MSKKQKLIPPDFTQGLGCTGGNLQEIPGPYVRKFGDHSSARRRVRLLVQSWVGTSAFGAKHVYVRLEVEDNPIWNPIEGCWQRFWDDKGHEWGDFNLRESLRTGFLYTDDYATKITAWVKRKVKKHFPLDKFEICEDYTSIDPKTWVYKVDGD